MVILVVALVLLVVGPSLLLARPQTTFKSSVTGDSQTAPCRAGVTAVVGGGSRYSSVDPYKLDPSSESDPTLRAIQDNVVAHASDFATLSREANGSCVRTVRIAFAIGVSAILAGVTLFVLRRRLPGKRRDLRAEALGLPGT